MCGLAYLDWKVPFGHGRKAKVVRSDEIRHLWVGLNYLASVDRPFSSDTDG